MEQFYFLLLLSLFSIVNIHGRAFDLNTLLESDDEQTVPQYSVVPRKSLNLYSKDDDQHQEMKLGQVSGLAASVQNPNLLFVFHRASREWNVQSFPDGINFDRKTFGPIPENPMLTVDTRTGQILNQWGNNTFSMPHGLSSDTEGNLWLTDVAMHQVFKYSKGELMLTLGQSFVAGNDEKHFCKPTDVVVSMDRSKIFVADGYCNSRIAIFNGDGKYLRQYTMKSNQRALRIPHSLVLIETLDLLCVADRENGRIVCFDSGLDENDDDEGEIKAIITHSTMKTVYALSFDSNKERLYAVSGGSGNDRALGYTFSGAPETFGQLISTWKPNNKFGEPHDLTLNINGRSLFVAEIRPNRIDSFDIIN